MRCLSLALFLLVPTLARAESQANVLRSAQSGDWSAPATWEGNQVPGAGARVLIREGHRVRYDVDSKAVLRGLVISGTLSFIPDRDTRLEVGLIAISPSNEYSEEGFNCDLHASEPDAKKAMAALEVGRPNQPIQAGKTALIRLHYQEGMDKDSCPAIVCCSGRMDFHGNPMNRTWVRLGLNAKIGDKDVTLAESVTGWKKGDRVVITGTNTHGDAKQSSYSEERTVQSVEGSKITFDEPLKYSHLGEGEFRGEVANLSRNVVVESADPAGMRGHTMYHKYSDGSLSYSEFRHLGKKNVLGRYSIHFHLVGDTMRGSSVIGNSIWDSHNRWITIHGTNFLVVRDNVGYKSVGHGYFLEDGTEMYNVLDRNLAVLAERGKRLPKQVLGFDANEGAGFWWANSLNTFTRNVATECDLYGFRYEATPTSAGKLVFRLQMPDGSKQAHDIRTMPFVRFDDNEVHSSHGLYGVNLGEGVNRVGPDAQHPFIVRNLKIWDVHYGFRPQVPNLLVENLILHKVAYGVYHPNYDNHVYRNVRIAYTNTEPFNRGHDDASIQFGSLTVDGLTFEGCRSGGMPLIQISDNNPTGKAESHFRNLKLVDWKDGSGAKSIVNLGGGSRPEPKTEKGVSVFVHDWFGPGKHAHIVSVKSGEFKSNADAFRKEANLTGNDARVAEVAKLTFPTLLDPKDDLPPTSVITHVVRTGSKTLVKGSTADNGTVKSVSVNGRPVRSTAPNFAEWEVEIDMLGEGRLEAIAEDEAGNREKLPMVVAR